ncbi:hypothetical protein F4780DRAFT_38946 [Xylariomycetidae sp. FL0641]|nr:hypothetical protein F4780DRAFT_38946 [Xylariomycetidae sp. FL0641]
MAYRVLYRRWQSKAAMYIMMVAELASTVSLLVLFGIEQPDLIRTKLWQAGYELGFNSSPAVKLYAYANHVPQPNLPFVWSQTLTDFNVAISVMSLFFLLTKLIAFIMDVWYPLIALFFNLALVALYAASAGGQAGPDHMDPRQSSDVAWYIANPCSVAANEKVQGNCALAKGTFAATIVMLSICVVNLGLNIWAMMPNEADKHDYDEDEDDEYATPASALKQGSNVEMHPIPATPRTGTVPFTPRTQAFNQLERKLPLRYS